MGENQTDRKPRVAVLGAGPAGLTAAYLLAKAGVKVDVFEAHPHYVGGICRTETYRGFGFDIGGHRFFSKSRAVEDLWTEILGDDLVVRPRSSRIYFRGKFFAYPLKAWDALRKLGWGESIACLFSYFAARLRRYRAPARNFEEWVTRHFGHRLYSLFFKTYTEKVWGMDCRTISADWAAQRIKGLSLGTAIRHAILGTRGSGRETIKTLIGSFRYPRRGPGMLWEEASRKMQALGGTLHAGTSVTGCALEAGRWKIRTSPALEREETYDHVISSVALGELIPRLEPEPTAATVAAAKGLRYRDFLIVPLILNDRGAFDDHWLYIHDPKVKVGRVQNFKSWSADLVPDPALTCYGLEYFCFEGDGLWSLPDEELIALAARELAALGLAGAQDVLDGCVVRQRKAYPVYDESYRARVDRIRSEVSSRYPGLHLVGRNGMHKYDNQDHAMMTAMLTVRNILEGTSFDVWRVNQDAEYHEESAAGPSSEGRLVPFPVPTAEVIPD